MFPNIGYKNNEKYDSIPQIIDITIKGMQNLFCKLEYKILELPVGGSLAL